MKHIHINIILLQAILLLACAACKQDTSRPRADYALNKSEKKVIYPLDSSTKTFIHTLQLYIDKNGEEYLTFQNQDQNKIIFYHFATGKLAFKLEPEMNGSNGTGLFYGYYIHNFDSIFLTNHFLPQITMIDKHKKVIEKLVYGDPEDSNMLNAYYSITNYYNPLVITNHKLYLTYRCNRWAAFNPVAAVIDMQTHVVRAFPSFIYPHFPGADNKAKAFGVEEYLSRCYDGNRFIYSFYFDEDLYVAPLEHDSIRRVKTTSRYMKKVTIWDDYGRLTLADIAGNPNYGNILYDPYREVYYRIVYPSTAINRELTDRQLMELLQYGRTQFSILILDKDLKVIGETLFPENTYNSQLMFIRHDGLYISDSHPLNPEYSDDVLSFRRFDLTKK